MHVRDITGRQFDAIVAEMDNPTLQCGVIEMVSGRHHLYGMTILLRDAERCMALVDHPKYLDVTGGEQDKQFIERLN